MDNVLIVSEKEETLSRLSALLETLPQVRVQAAVDAESAMSCAQGADPALVLIAAPLDGTEKLCRGLLDNTYASVVLLCTKGTPPDGVIALADSSFCSYCRSHCKAAAAFWGCVPKTPRCTTSCPSCGSSTAPNAC